MADSDSAKKQPKVTQAEHVRRQAETSAVIKSLAANRAEVTRRIMERLAVDK